MFLFIKNRASKQVNQNAIPAGASSWRVQRVARAAWQGIALSLFLVLVLGQLPAKSVKNTLQPETRIPVKALGYMPPGALPALYYHALVQLNFIDTSHLLFTFNIHKLLQRRDDCPISTNQREARSVVLDIPTGKANKQADWELYDFDDFLWGIGNGQFLLRRCLRFDLFDASLNPQPLFLASGLVQRVLFSPDHSIVVIEQNEGEPGSRAGQNHAKLPAVTPHQAMAPEVGVQFVQLHPLTLLARSRIPVPGTIPIVAEGILEALGGEHHRWTIDIQAFQGESVRNIASVRSFCIPSLTPVTNHVFVAMVCPSSEERVFEAYTVRGDLLWKIPSKSDGFLPDFILTRDGAHFAIETLHLKRFYRPLDPLSRDDIDGQLIEVYDTKTGIRIGSVTASPVYLGGKNADFSPDGTRIAVLHNGAIEIYTLKALARNSQ